MAGTISQAKIEDYLPFLEETVPQCFVVANFKELIDDTTNLRHAPLIDKSGGKS